MLTNYLQKFFKTYHSTETISTMDYRIFIILLMLLAAPALGLRKTPVIEIAQGKLRGIAGNTENKYLGIPYATVVERYRAPGDPPRWQNVFEANQPIRSCKQYLSRLGLPVGREDCLVLNVYTPLNAGPRKLLPVMVFIHGGGFYWGGSSSLLYDPVFLVEKRVIVVTLNYRLGAFGFLCLDIEGAPGNAGLKDQVAALKWVNENIRAFGGNPNSVTLFGESAGAASVHYLVLSRLTKGLFHRAIMQSGTALSPFAYAQNPIRRASEVAERLGYKTTDSKELLEIFRNSSANDIILATQTDVVNEDYIFRPCAESRFKDEPFITKPPHQIISSGVYNKVPMIIGYNDKEGIRYAGTQTTESLADYNGNFELLFPDNLGFYSDREMRAIGRQVKYYYYGNESISWNNIGGIIDFYSDTFFHYPSVETSKLHLMTSKQPLHNYYFKYDSLRNLGKLISGLPMQQGASHTDDLFYMFQPAFWIVPLTVKDKEMVEKMTKLWTDFAKTSDPTPTTSKLIPVHWNASNSSRLDFFNLDVQLSMRALPNPQRVQFWTDIYNKYGIQRP